MFIPYTAVLDITFFNLYAKTALFIAIGVSVVSLTALRRLRKSFYKTMLLSTFFMVISIVTTNGGWGSLITYITALFVMEITTYGDFSKAQYRWANIFSLFVLLFIFFISFRYAEQWLYYQEIDINPNTLGMMIMFSFMIWYCTANQSLPKMRFFKPSCITLFLITIYGMLNLKSRGTLLAVFSFGILNILPPTKFDSRAIFKLSLLIIGVGILFPYFFLVLYEKGINITILGKSLYTGRQNIWSNMFATFNNNIFHWTLGIGSKSQLWENHNLNVHNDYFAIIANFGLIGFFLFEIYILKYIKSACKAINSFPKNRAWLFMFISTVLILGISETVSHWAVIYIFAYMGLGLSQAQSPKKPIFNPPFL